MKMYNALQDSVIGFKCSNDCVRIEERWKDLCNSRNNNCKKMFLQVSTCFALYTYSILLSGVLPLMSKLAYGCLVLDRVKQEMGCFGLAMAGLRAILCAVQY